MARSIAEIQNQIIAYKNAQPELAGLSSNSRRAIWYLWTYIIAAGIAVFEQLQDLFLSNVEAVVARSSAASALWIQDKFLKFQYSATTPQIVQLIDTVPQYPVVDENLRIITACAVITQNNNTVDIKLAKNNPYGALDPSELSAAQNYINTIGVAGINYNCISLDADRIYIEADIYYKGQYSSVIQTNMITALDNWFTQLSQINFNGDIKMSDLEAVIRNVTGVNDVVIKNVRVRANTVSFANGTDLILNTAVLQRLYNPVAGYIIQEDTSGQTFADSLNFIPQ